MLLSWIGRCDHNPRLISTQLVQMSQVLRFWTFGCVSSWVELSRSSDHNAQRPIELNSTELSDLSVATQFSISPRREIK